MGRIGAMLCKFAVRNNFAFGAIIAMSLGFSACTALNPLAPLPESKRSTSHKTSPVLHGEKQDYTGKVVLVGEGYRLRLSDSDEVLRLSRAKRKSELVNEEVDLRKYYEKSLAVQGKREGEWLWDAEIVGQWNKPGESRGPNMLAPPGGR